MKLPIIFLFCFLIANFCAEDAIAIGIGVVPDKLVFDGSVEQAAIINPNNITLEFKIKADDIDCKPSEGKIMPHSKVTIMCDALDNARNGIILFETMSDNGSVGVLPAVAIKTELIGSILQSSERLDVHNPLEIIGNSYENIPSNNTTNTPEHLIKSPAMNGMNLELITIALLIVAILFVLGYTEIKKRKEDKKESICLANF